MLKQWVSELEGEVEILRSDEINDEANANMNAFGISDEMMDSLSEEELSNFIQKCAHVYAQKTKGILTTFYCWYDDQAFQVRVGCVSEKHGKLPFGCKIQSIDLDELIANFKVGVNGLFTENEALFVWQKSI
ncbi:hypothetical protein TUM4644_35550 [Shewanella colwelliana]|uniref:hypothetical protein n=1 Tax=Shewanella colwelliana TaxID=23 RepID=UPI001BBBEB74|nr:hypothetical protein [Shewanella colwelliana]GIU34326.1 hypothetical protein TUM4644_35550 [Shewanella colwelliana]